MSRRTAKCPWDSPEFKNEFSKSLWFQRYYNIALSRIEWLDLPDNVDARFMELNALWRGVTVWFNDPDLGVINLPFIQQGPPNVFGNPSLGAAFSYNGYYVDGLDETNSVVMYSNISRTPEVPVIQHYSNMISNIDRTIEVNLNNQKQPVLIVCDDSEQLTYANVLQQYSDNWYKILGTKNFNPNNIKIVSPANGQYNLDKLAELKRIYWREGLALLGIEVATTDKAERLTRTESSMQYGEIEINRQVILEPRQRAADLVNKMFGTNIKVRFRSDLDLSRIADVYDPKNPQVAEDTMEVEL